MIIIAASAILYLINRQPTVSISRSESFDAAAQEFRQKLVDRANSDSSMVTLGGNDMDNFDYSFYVTDEMKLMAEAEFLRKLVSCSLLEYPDGRVLIMRGSNIIEMRVDSGNARVNDSEQIELGAKLTLSDEGKLFVPVDEIAKYLGIRVDYYVASNWIDMAILDNNADKLPEAYDMRDYGRVTAVRDQGKYGTCWAFSSLGALETTLMPMEEQTFSVDHMSLSNSYSLDQNTGGEHSMSIAYLSAWQGPVYEKDDPYGDGITNESLKAVKHLEEALIIDGKDMEALKTAIFRYGGVETSLYLQMAYTDSVSMYYSTDNYSYYYNGDEKPNHDVVVVGWDDNYPKEKFTIKPAGDGAFICKNSWGTEFGEDGYFYVSYYDANICNKAVVYTRVGEADNYDKIYQSDLLGCIGQMGFGKDEAYIANVYESGEGEELAAVSFYTLGKNTDFEVYFVENFEGDKSLKNRQFVVSGNTKYAGYYTVDFPEPIRLRDRNKYAVVVKLKTPGVIHPVAIEYDVDERTANFDITDGEGYISLYGEVWYSAEEKENCNVCLKAFTNYVQ